LVKVEESCFVEVSGLFSFFAAFHKNDLFLISPDEGEVALKVVALGLAIGEPQMLPGGLALFEPISFL
jgi:hypothetical protein